MHKKLLLVLLASTISLVGCSDSGIDSEYDLEPQEPIIGNVTEVQMNTDAMTAPSDPENENMAVYVNAHATLGNFLTSTQHVYTILREIFEAARLSDYTVDEDEEVFTWEFTTGLSAFDEHPNTTDMSFRLTANTSDPSKVSWDLTIVSGQFLGNTLEDINMLVAETAPDGDSGTINLLFGDESQGKFFSMSFVWMIENDEVTELTQGIRILSEVTDMDVDVTANYTVTSGMAELNLMVYNEQAGGHVPVLIGWNLDGSGGYFNPPTSDAICWDANKMNVAC